MQQMYIHVLSEKAVELDTKSRPSGSAAHDDDSRQTNEEDIKEKKIRSTYINFNYFS